MRSCLSCPWLLTPFHQFYPPSLWLFWPACQLFFLFLYTQSFDSNLCLICSSFHCLPSSHRYQMKVFACIEITPGPLQRNGHCCLTTLVDQWRGAIYGWIPWSFQALMARNCLKCSCCSNSLYQRVRFEFCCNTCSAIAVACYEFGTKFPVKELYSFSK